MNINQKRSMSQLTTEHDSLQEKIDQFKLSQYSTSSSSSSSSSLQSYRLDSFSNIDHFEHKKEESSDETNQNIAISVYYQNSQNNNNNNNLIKPKIKPFIVSRRNNNHFKVNRAVNYVELFITQINDQNCFMLAGDFTVDKSLFQKLNMNQKEAYCPLHNYRPQVAVQAGRNYVVCTLNQSYNGITDVLAPVQMLRLLQNQAAFEVSTFLNNYSNYINQMSLIRSNLQASTNQADLIEQIKANHISSLKIAHEAMEKADKNKVYVFLYMKFDYEACTNKLYFVGGNTKFAEVFLGENDINLMRQYCQRYSFPHFNDVSGVLNVLYSKFQCKNSYNANLMTFDDESIPFEGIRNFVPLNSLEVAPGLFVGDKFEMRELKVNAKILENVQNNRKMTNQLDTYLKIDDLGYTLEAEAFVQKYYNKKAKKSKTNPPTSESSFPMSPSQGMPQSAEL